MGRTLQHGYDLEGILLDNDARTDVGTLAVSVMDSSRHRRGDAAFCPLNAILLTRFTPHARRLHSL